MGLWAKYTGEGLTAGTIPDQSGNGRDLTNNGVTAIASPFTPGGSALNFIPATDYATLGTSGNILPVPGTYCFYCQPQEAGPWYWSSNSGDMFFAGLSSFYAQVEGVYQLFGPALTINTNHAVVIQFDSNGDAQLFVDDMDTPVATHSGSPVLNSAGLQLGRRGTLGDPYTYDGYLGDFCIYDQLLDATQRAEWAATGDVTFTPPAPEVDIEPAVGTRFFLTLTGAADATTDIMLPCSNISARLRSGSPSYLQATIPYTDDYAEAVTDRPNGDLVLTHSDATADTDILTVDLETPQISRGTESSSIVLTGHRQTTNSSPSSHDVIAQSIQTGATSTMTVPGYNPAILPGDDISSEGVSFTIGLVTLQAYVSNNSINIQTIYSEGS